MGKRILGIDIRYSAVSAVLLTLKDKGEYQVEDYAYIPISDHQVLENIISTSIETILKKINITKSFCIASFPPNNIRYRNLILPFTDRKKINLILPYELEQLIPIPIEKFITAFMIYESSDAFSKLITTSVETSELQSYLNAFAAYNIDPFIVTPGGISTAKSFLYLKKDLKDVLIIDIEIDKCTLFFISFREIKMIRSFKINLLVENIELFHKDIHRTITIFQELNNIKYEPESIFLTGYGLNDNKLKEKIENFFNISTKELDLSHEFKISVKNKDDIEWIPHRMDSALSLAIAGLEKIDLINFRKDLFETKKALNLKNIFIQISSISCVILFIFFLKFYYNNKSLEKELCNINNQIINIFKKICPEIKHIVNPMQQLRTKIDSYKKNKNFDFGKQVRFIDILLQISNVIPEEIPVELNEIKGSSNEVVLIGTTDNFNYANEIKINLERANLFKKVTITSVSQDNIENKVKFTMILNI
ncbi:MAG: PilN domain-containing protein [Desulfobacterales bacterium]|nr:PilN domain-containing protein [Desulfobacterales bacterium]